MREKCAAPRQGLARDDAGAKQRALLALEHGDARGAIADDQLRRTEHRCIHQPRPLHNERLGGTRCLRVAHNAHAVAFGQRKALARLMQANLGALEIEHNGDVAPHTCGGVTGHPCVAKPVLTGAVRAVDAHTIHPGANHLAQDQRVVGRGPEGGDDLGSAFRHGERTRDGRPVSPCCSTNARIAPCALHGAHQRWSDAGDHLVELKPRPTGPVRIGAVLTDVEHK